MPAPADVDAFFPRGNSPFGVADLIGNVWNFLDEFRDLHTRSVLLKGSSFYRPNSSGWYFRSTLELWKHNKYLLMDERYDRAGAIGFRCVADV